MCVSRLFGSIDSRSGVTTLRPATVLPTHSARRLKPDRRQPRQLSPAYRAFRPSVRVLCSLTSEPLRPSWQRTMPSGKRSQALADEGRAPSRCLFTPRIPLVIRDEVANGGISPHDQRVLAVVGVVAAADTTAAKPHLLVKPN